MAIASNALIHCEQIIVIVSHYGSTFTETVKVVSSSMLAIIQLLDVGAHVVNGCKRIKLKVNPIDGLNA